MAERVCVELLGDMVVNAAMHPETVEKFDADGNLVERIVKPPNLYHAIRILERRHPHWKPTAEVSDDQRRVNAGCASIVDGKLRFGRAGGDV
jgi:hypothetical protein